MSYKILHAKSLRNFFDIDSNEEAVNAFANPENEYELVANVDADDLDEVFKLTNSINSSWVMNSEVDVIAEGKAKIEERGGLRSSSVGDVFIKSDTLEAYMVAGFGFEKINEAEDSFAW